MSARQLHAAFVAVQGDLVLLPHVAIIETIGMDRLRARTAPPGWWIGSVMLDGREVPVVSLEHFMGRPLPEHSRAQRIVLLQSLGTALPDGRIGLLSLGHPQLAALSEPALAPDADAAAADGVLTRVRVGATRALIPDLEALERALATAMRQAAPA